jgi:pilus assembly protein FimV
MESGESHDVEPPAPRISDFRNDLDAQAFDKTEPLDAFSKINLDLDDGDYGASVGKTDFGQKTDVWQAMATKLDLALAYSDIGDKDGARELLDEVVRNGDQAQADRARTLIGGLD